MKRFTSNFLNYLLLLPFILIPAALVQIEALTEAWFWIMIVGWHCILAYYDPFGFYKGP